VSDYGRPYADVVRDLLTVLTGGTVNEVKEIGAVPPDLIPLDDRPVRRVSHLAGKVLVGKGEQERVIPWRFSERDFELVPADGLGERAAIRIGRRIRLAPFSTLEVNYYPQRLRPTPITDTNVGSVARTLLETIAREMATQYQQLQLVHEGGFVETAKGDSLDKVVALVDVRRIVRGSPVGKVRFSRAAGSAGTIFIPIDSVVTDGKGTRYRTTVEASLVPNQISAEVWAHGESPRTKLLPAGALTILERAIAGVASVSNVEGTWAAAEDETDDQLRARAQRAIHATGRGTRDALRFGLESLPFVSAVSIAEYPDPAVPMPGQVLLTVACTQDTPGNRAIVAQRVEELRPAGIFIETRFAGALKLAVQVDPLFAGDRLDVGQQEAARATIRDTLVARVAGLAPGATLRMGPMLAQLLADARLADVRLGWTADGAPIADGAVLPSDKAARLAPEDILFGPVAFERQPGTAAPVSLMIDLDGRFASLALSEAGAIAAVGQRLQLFAGGLAGGAEIGFDALAAAIRNDASYVIDLDALVIVVETAGGGFIELRRGDPAFVAPAGASVAARAVRLKS
jgi:hypothetical protein